MTYQEQVASVLTAGVNGYPSLHQPNWAVIVGGAEHVQGSMPADIVQAIVTSPPYWRQRDYQIESPLIPLGQEETVGEYVANVVTILRESRRVLRPDGLLFLNIGDTYIDKHMIGVPWQLAFALRDDGWILRSDVIWHKPNTLSESVADRPPRCHEYIFMLSKSENYYFDAEAIKEPARHKAKGGRAGMRQMRSKRTVWSIPITSYPGAHFAVYPTALPEICILAATSEAGCCPACGAPYTRVVDKERVATRPGTTTKVKTPGEGGNRDPERHVTFTATTGWACGCECNAGDPIPQLILDPFVGSGTTLQVANHLRRRSIGIDPNPSYCDLAADRAARRIRRRRKLKPEYPDDFRPLLEGLGDDEADSATESVGSGVGAGGGD